jgi:opacity protein-like surface antigen
VKLLVAALAAAAMAMAPMAAAAAPSPSPSLDTVLAKPPSGYTEVTTSSLNGRFSAHEYAQNASGVSPQETESTLNKDGFVDGYAKTWVSASPRRALVELVMAFTGGAGARKVMTALETSDKADARFTHTDTMTGIDPYYGVHFAGGGTFADEFVFVKGNDLFGVAVGAPTDNVLKPAQDQTTSQFDSAPSETIPSSQWPENATHNVPLAIGAIGALIPIVLVAIVVIGVGLLLVARSRRPAAAMAGAMSPGIPMSPDGNYWWDGQAWRDAAREAPPFAQRSSDGTLWWDGRTWRPVPPPAA